MDPQIMTPRTSRKLMIQARRSKDSAVALFAQEDTESECDPSSVPEACRKDCELHTDDVPQNTWGVCIFAIVHDLTFIMNPKVKAPIHLIMRFGFSMGAQFLNLSLQVMILWYVSEFVVKESMIDIQKMYKTYHQEVFNSDGEFLHEVWKTWPMRQTICSSAISKYLFTEVILFLWITQIWGEIRGWVILSRNIVKLPLLPRELPASRMLRVELSDDPSLPPERNLVAITPFARGLIWIFVLVPELGIALYLGWMGLRFLVASQTFGDLILNALALAFVNDIDEMILANIFPKRILITLDQFKFAYQKNPDIDSAMSDDEKEDIIEENRNFDIITAYRESIIYLIIIAMAPFLYIHFLQQVLPHYSFDVRQHCMSYTESKKLMCTMGEAGCFPFGPGGLAPAEISGFPVPGLGGPKRRHRGLLEQPDAYSYAYYDEEGPDGASCVGCDKRLTSLAEEMRQRMQDSVSSEDQLKKRVAELEVLDEHYKKHAAELEVGVDYLRKRVAELETHSGSHGV